MDQQIRDLISGNEGAFRALVKKYQSRVFHHAMQILRNREEAEDVCQETFIQVYESVKSFKGQSSLSTWIIRIAINKALEKLRKEKRRAEAPPRRAATGRAAAGAAGRFARRGACVQGRTTRRDAAPGRTAAARRRQGPGLGRPVPGTDA